MSNNSLVTSVTHSNADVMTGKQKPYWVEIQLVDEQKLPVANIPWIAESSHPVSGSVNEFTYSGQSDAEGLIRIDMRHGLELKLTLDGNQLATEMETRSLRVGRDAVNDSRVRPEAEENGHIWHYAVIGELCRTLPSIQLRPGEIWPPFHFSEKKIMKGLTLYSNQLQMRHILEICPFRVWELVLHHQKEYSLANALNLGGNACLAYSDNNMLDKVSINRFFLRQCQDLSKLPMFYKGDDSYNALVCDVPYSKRYYPPVFMDTSKDTSVKMDNKNGTMPTKENTAATQADGDTQFYYVYNTDKVIVSWRGTASLYNVGTDMAFRPVNSESCDIDKTECTALLSAGKVHTGFWSGYNRVERKFRDQIIILEKLADNRKLYICGHSLGGALALIHATSMRSSLPLLYTYGMPRTFTKNAIEQLSDIIHYRHVNDNDPVPAVPPDANLDNELYKLWGPLGSTFGMMWSAGELMAHQLKSWGDCFWHHGNIVSFFTATQFRKWKECKIDFPTPYGCITLSGPMPIRAKFYLVPSLAEKTSMDAGIKQQEYKSSLTQHDLDKYLPKGNNPSRLADLTFNDHFMTSYMPYINNKLLGLIDEKRLSKEKLFSEHSENIKKFKEQMIEEKNNMPSTETHRNEIFMALEKMLGEALKSTLLMKDGHTTLERFALYGEEDMENV